jgi:hypothetical protein
MVELIRKEEAYLDDINMKRVNRVLHSLDLIPNDKGAILLLRHGERFQVPHGLGNKNIHLTKMGKRSSRVLGEVLRDRVEYVTASGLYSCMESALGLSLGSGYSGTLKNGAEWGIPGVFVDDKERAAAYMKQRGVIETYGHMTRNPQSVLPGMKSCYHGAAVLVRDLHFFKIPKGKISVYITHDSLLACLIGAITGREVTAATWPTYMEGFVLWVDKWKMVVANRGKIIPTKGPF